MTLRRAYDEIMENIKVTPEMRERVLKRVAQEAAPAKPKVLSVPKLKKYLSAAACLVLVIAGAAVLPRLLAPAQPDPPPVAVVPTIEEAASLQELSRLVGFQVDTGFALPFEPEETTYCSYWNELAQIRYSGAGRTATYRQSVGTQDNSGDYNVYASSSQLDINGLSVTLKGDSGVYVLAVWTDGTYAYSLSLSDGMTQAEWAAALGTR